MPSSKGAARNKPLKFELTPEMVHGFWAAVDQHPQHGGCWLWEGPKDTHGYPMVQLGTHRWSCRRLSWVLHHRQALPSYHQVRTTPDCKIRACVRPEHLVRRTRSFANFRKRWPNKPYHTIYPPPLADAATPRQATLRALERYIVEIAEVKKVLVALAPALAKLEQTNGQRFDLLRRSVLEIHAGQQELSNQIRQLRPMTKAEPTDQPEEAAPEKVIIPTPAPAPAPENARVMAFRSALGVLANGVSVKDLPDLDAVFAIAGAEAGGNDEKATRLVGQWLTSFAAKARADSTIEATPAQFARMTLAGEL